MATEIRVPTLGESVTEATIGKWFKKVGDAVAADEPLVELETDKVTVEVPSPAAGVLVRDRGQGRRDGRRRRVARRDRRRRRCKAGKEGRGRSAATKPEAVAQASAPTGAVDGQGSRGARRQDRRRRPGRGAQDAAGAVRRQAARREQHRGRPGAGLGQARPGAEGRRARRHRQGRAVAAGRDARGSMSPECRPRAVRRPATRRARSACA